MKPFAQRVLLLVLLLTALVALTFALASGKKVTEAPIDPSAPTVGAYPAGEPVKYPKGTYPYCMGRTGLPCLTPDPPK